MEKEEQYLEYLADVEIAKEALSELKLEIPAGALVSELYAMPSHNHQAYYAKIYEENGQYYVLYARSVIDHYDGSQIYMYPFRTVKKVGEERGRIVCGLKKLKDTFVKQLLEGLQNIPEKHILEDNWGIILDGVLQAVRVYEKEEMVKEVVYLDPQFLPIADVWKTFFENLYMEVEKIIG